MASLTDPISTQNIVDRFADYVSATANSGISWGTNAYPFGEFDNPGLFGGSTGGKGIEINGTSIVNTPINASTIYSTLLAETARYTRIRNFRVTLDVSGAGGNSGSRPTAGTIFDQTAVSHMNTAYVLTTGYLEGAGASAGSVSTDQLISSANLEALFARLRSAYNAARSVSGGTYTTTVCHASCHSSCHSSRGRR